MYTLEDGSLRATFEQSNGQILATLVDLETGESWGPTDAVQLEAMDILCQRSERTKRPALKLARNGDVVEISITDIFHQVSAIVRFTLDNGTLVVTIPTDAITENRSLVSLMDGLHILPDLMAVSPSALGYLVLPIQNGAVCFPERHGRLHDRFLIYGEQKRWEDLPMLPLCAAIRNSSALLAVAESGECDAECRVDLDGKGGGITGFAMRYRYTPVDPVDPVDRVVRYVPLRGKDASYAGIGRYMHQFVLRTFGRGLLADRAATNPHLDYAARSYTIKFFHALKEISSFTGEGEFFTYTTFDQACEQLHFLKRHGIDRIWFQSVGWNPGGHDGLWPTRFPIEERLGGETGFRGMIECGKQLGYQMTVHDNYKSMYERSPDYDPDLCIGSVYGGPLKMGLWGGGICYPTRVEAFPDSRISGEMERIKALGVEGVYYIDGMGNPLMLTYNPKHGDNRYRRSYAEGIQRILKSADQVFGASATEAGFLYCAAYTDSIASTWYPEVLNPDNELVDWHIPLWCMTLRGIIFYESRMIYPYVTDMGNGREWSFVQRLLNLAEVGMKPRTENTYVASRGWGYPVEACIEGMKFEYDLMFDTLASMVMAPLTDHAVLDGNPALGDHVTCSEYADGTVVMCDYAHERLEVNGENIALPHDFVKKPAVPKGERPAIPDQPVPVARG